MSVGSKSRVENLKAQSKVKSTLEIEASLRRRSSSTSDLLVRAEERRIATQNSLEAERQELAEQYFTPNLVASIMASLPKITERSSVRILDPGAGSGILTAAMVQTLLDQNPRIEIEVVAVESDDHLLSSLRATLSDCEELGVKTRIVNEDFVTWALHTDEKFDFIIQNPPYAKLPVASETFGTLKSAGFKIPNIYAAFMILGADLLYEAGQQVSITPRSWMNGTYFSKFRRDLLERVSIDAIHTFESRSKVFGDSGVLQESIIVCASKRKQSDTVILQISMDFRDEIRQRVVPATQVVSEDYLFVPATDADGQVVEWMNKAKHTLDSLGISVSTGRVVDFRSREYLHNEPSESSYPMVYPANLSADGVVHPRESAKKPQWFSATEEILSKNLVPAGVYVLVKRFSAKEEKRRIVSNIWNSSEPPAFDNKLNYFHSSGRGLELEIAVGLSKWMNSTQVDRFFRVFSGHTQVNAGDLRMMKYPSLEQLRAIAASIAPIDESVEKVMNELE